MNDSERPSGDVHGAPWPVLVEMQHTLNAILDRLSEVVVELRRLQGQPHRSPPTTVAAETAPPAAPAAGGRSELAAALVGADAEGHWTAAVAALDASDGPHAEAQALARLLAMLPAPLPDGFIDVVRRWLEEHADAARAAGIRFAPVRTLSAERERPRLAVAPQGGERPGIRVGDRLAVPPLLTLPDEPTARLVLALDESRPASVPWTELVALARGQPVADATLLAVLDWLRARPDGPLHRAEQDALGARGLAEITTPGPDDPRFDTAPLYRPGRAGTTVRRPAVALCDPAAPVAPRLLRKGLLRVHVADRPAAADFAAWEADALLADLAEHPEPYVRLEGGRVAAVDLAAVRREVAALAADVRAAERDGSAQRRATAFAAFLQGVLSWSPAPVESVPASWRERQHDFHRAAAEYLKELRLRERAAGVGKPAAGLSPEWFRKIVLPHERPGSAPGAVVEAVAPALYFEDSKDEPLPGTVLVNPSLVERHA